MAKLLGTTLLVAVLSVTAATHHHHHHHHQDSARHRDFSWNSRKLGNKRVASLTIREDEERDRRSIPLAVRDGRVTALHRGSREHHPHRHHHGEGTRLTMQQYPDQSLPLGESGVVSLSSVDAIDMRYYRGSAPLYMAESGREEQGMTYNDGVDGPPSEDRTVTLLESTGEEVASPLRPSPRGDSMSNTRRSSARRGRRRKKSRRNRNNRRTKRKKKKRCRRLRGQRKKNCTKHLRQCRGLGRQEKKKCQDDLFEAFLTELRQREESDFSFLTNMTEMSGTEACHYHYLKKCCTRIGLFRETTDSNMSIVKCHFRKEFLKCMEQQHEQGRCDPTFQTRGDLPTLRRKIKEFIWTPSSCLIADAVERWGKEDLRKLSLREERTP